MRTSFQIARIIGIPIKIHITFLLVLPFFTWVFAINPLPVGFQGIAPPMNYVWGAIATILLFTSVLLHELGHSWVAMRHGTDIREITLFIFGGVSQMEEVPREPATEAKMAFTGPFISFLIGVGFLGVYFGLNNQNVAGLNNQTFMAFVRLLLILGYVNLILFFFNLLPAFPMDGGRVLRSLLASRMNYLEATHRAVYVGKVLAFGMGLLGFLAPNIWLILIAFFIYIGASEEERGTVVQITLEGVKVKDLMTEEVITVKPEETVGRLIDLMFEEKHMGYPVIKDDRVVGVVTFKDVKNVPRDRWDEVMVKQIMTKSIVAVKPNDEATQALQIITTNNIGRVLVMENEKLVGIVSRTDITRAIEILSYEEG